MAALPFCHLTLRAEKPCSPGYPPALDGLGDHLRKRRLDLGLLQREVAAQLSVDEASILNWETHKTMPELRFHTRIIGFLGYDPFPEPQTVGERLFHHRQTRGLTREQLAKAIGVDTGTLARWEGGHAVPRGRHRKLVEAFWSEHGL